MLKENYGKKQVVALYIRLSSIDEDIDDSKIESNSIVNQRKFLQCFIKETREFLNSEVIEFVDDGYTATNDNRPRLKAMLEMARKKEINTIIVRDFSRFFRDYIEAGYYLEKELPTLGVRFISVNDNYDSNNFVGTTGGMEMVIRNIVYSAYSKDLSVKMKIVKKEMMKEGKFTGGFPPYGYIKNSNDKYKLIIDYVASINVKRIFDLALQGYKLSKIANILNDEKIETPRMYLSKLYGIKNKQDITNDIWNYSIIHRILTNELYIGNMVNNKKKKENLYAKRLVSKDNLIVIDNTHEAIISKADFESVQMKIAKKTEKTVRKNELYPLRSLLKCGECNKSMCKEKRKSTSDVYVCERCRTLYGRSKCIIKEDELEEYVLEIISKYIQMAKNENIKSNKNDKSDKTKSREDKIKILEAEKFELYKKYANGNIKSEDYLYRKQDIDKCIEEYRNEINEDIERRNKHDMREKLYSINCYELTYNMTHSFIEKIIIYDKERFEIVMKFGDIFTVGT